MQPGPAQAYVPLDCTRALKEPTLAPTGLQWPAPVPLAIVLSLMFTHDAPCQMHGVRDLGKSHHEEGQMVHRKTTTFTPCAAQLTGPSW